MLITVRPERFVTVELLNTYYEMALAALKEGRVQEARAGFERVVEMDPMHADAWHFLGLALHQAGESVLAVELIEKALGLANKAVYWANLGSVYREMKAYDKAETALWRALELKPDYALAMITLGHLLREQGNFEGALGLYRLAQSVAPQDPVLACYCALTQEGLGALDAAEESYREALRLAPDFASARHDYGLLLKKRGRRAEAEACLVKSVEQCPDNKLFAINLSALLKEQKRFDEAEALLMTLSNRTGASLDILNALVAVYSEKGAYDAALAITWKILSLAPDDRAAGNNLAVLLQREGRLVEAAGLYRRLLERNPDVVQTNNNYGVLLRDMGQGAEAEKAFRKALALDPYNPLACNNLALLLHDREALGEAEGLCRKAVELDPTYAEAWGNLGLILKDQKRFAEAEEAYRQSLHLAPQTPDVLNNYGVLCAGQQRLEEAEAFYRQALALAPDHANAWNNLGITLKDLTRFDEAMACYDRAIALQAMNADAHHNRALALLRLGRFAEGWPAYEWRYSPAITSPGAPTVPSYTQPMWRGEDLTGKTILIVVEQAFGDEIQFVRYGALLKEHRARVWLVTREPLVALMRQLPWAERVLVQGEEEGQAFDTWVFMLSLPLYLKLDADLFTTPVPYLGADAERVAYWRVWLTERKGNKKRVVGLVWAGNPYPPNRSLHLRQLSGLAAFHDILFVSFQRDEAVEQLHDAPEGLTIVDAGSVLKDFADSAALMAQLDLMVSIDSAPAHLAGALGIPVWTLVQRVPDWRWFMESEDTPWYPSMRLFRQTERGQWAPPVERLMAALAAWSKD